MKAASVKDPTQLDLSGDADPDAFMVLTREEIDRAYEDAVHELADSQLAGELERGRKLGRMEFLRSLRERFRSGADG